MLTDDDIARMAQRIVRRYDPLVVGIFGSYAIGTAHGGSDLDIVVIKQSSDSYAQRSRAVRRLLVGVLQSLDIHVFTPEEFEHAAREGFSFTWVIVRQARFLYVADGASEFLSAVEGWTDDVTTKGSRFLSTK